MLRHYDELGLLRPVQVDEESGYRYYAPGQLADLHRLLALKDLGFSLEQVGHFLGGGLSPDEVRGMLKLKRAELRQQLEEGYGRLQRIESRLLAFEDESDVAQSRTEVVTRRMEPVRVASVRDVLPGFEQGGQLRSELQTLLERAGVRPPQGFERGHCYIYHDPDYHEQKVDTEVAYPLPAALPPNFAENKRVRVGLLPGGEAACIVHRGDVWTMNRAYHTLGRWIAANGWRIVGPNRIHIVQGGPVTAEQVREIIWPIARHTP